MNGTIYMHVYFFHLFQIHIMNFIYSITMSRRFFLLGILSSSFTWANNSVFYANFPTYRPNNNQQRRVPDDETFERKIALGTFAYNTFILWERVNEERRRKNDITKNIESILKFMTWICIAIRTSYGTYTFRLTAPLFVPMHIVDR